MFHEKPWGKASVGDAHFSEYLRDRNSYFLRKRNITIEAHRLLTCIFHYNPDQRLTLQEFRDSLVSMPHFFVPPTEAIKLRRHHCEHLITYEVQLRRILKFIRSQRNRKCVLPPPSPSPRNDPYLHAILNPSVLTVTSPEQQPKQTKTPHPALIPDPLVPIMDSTLLVPPPPNYAMKYESSFRTPPLSHSRPQGSHVPSGSSFASVIIQTPEQRANQNPIAVSQPVTEIDLGGAYGLFSDPPIIAEVIERKELDQSFAEKTRPDICMQISNGSLDICIQIENEPTGSPLKRNVLKRFTPSMKGVALLS